MSENGFGTFCDEQKMLEYVYDDVDDSDIFATDPLNNSFSESDPKSESDPAPNPEIIHENESLKETVEKLQKEKDILELRISELYKTARAELDRKDRRLKELQNEKDDIVFRRENIRNKPFNVDTRVPVLQQVEKDLNNEGQQDFIARYRIPKKITYENQDPSENKELHTKLDHNLTLEEKCNRNSDDRPTPSTSNTGKDCNKHKEYSDKNSKDNHTGDRSRSREKLDSRQPPNKENGAIRSPSNNNKPSSNEDCNPKNIQGRSKSSSRYKNDSLEHYVKKPRSPSRERQEMFQNKRNRSKSMNEDVKFENKSMHFSSTSKEKEQVHLPRARGRSPLYDQRPPSQSYKQNSDKGQVKDSNHLSRSQDKKPRSPSREKQEEVLSTRSRSKSINEDSKSVDSKLHCNTTSRDKKQVSTFRERSRSVGIKNRSSSNEPHKKKSGLERSKSSSRYKNVFPEHRVGPRTPSVERVDWSNKRSRLKSMNEEENCEEKTTYSTSTYKDKEQVHLSRERGRSPSKNHCARRANVSPRQKEHEDMKLTDERMYDPTSRQIRDNYPSRERSKSPSNEEVFTTKGSIRSSNSTDRHKPPYPEYCKRQPRTPSAEREQGEFSDKSTILKEIETTFSSNSRTKEKASKQEYSKGHFRTGSMEKECDKQSARLSNRHDHEDNNRSTTKSTLQSNKDICESIRRYRGDSSHTRSTENDHKAKNINADRDTVFGGKSRGRSCSPSSSRNKGSGNIKNRLGFKESREKDRSRSGSYDRDKKRGIKRTKSISGERYRRRFERDDAKNGRRFHQDRSNSSSTERDERQFTNKAKSLIRRDKYGKVINYHRKYRSRSRSRERPLNVRRLQDRDEKFRVRDFGQLRERVLRYSMSRGSQALRDRQEEDRISDKDRHKTLDKMKVTTNNQSDYSDLDEMRLHLSGDSDLDSENNDHKKKRDEISDLLKSDDKDFAMVKDIGAGIQDMSDEDLQRLLDTKKKLFNKLSNLNEDEKNVNSSPAVQFGSPKKIYEINEEHIDTEHMQRPNVFSHCDNDNMDELDYEHSEIEFPINLKREKKEESSRIERRVNRSEEIANNPENQRLTEDNLKNAYEEKITRYQKDESWHTSNTVLVRDSWHEETGVKCNKEPARNLFELRQQRKSIKLDQASEKSLNIIRKNTRAPIVDVKSLKEESKFDLQEEPDKHGNNKYSFKGRNQSKSLEKYKDDKIVLKNCESNKEIIPESCDVFQYINNVKQVFVKVGQECNITRNKIATSLSNVTKGIHLGEKLISEDSSCKSGVVSGKSVNANPLKLINEEKEIENVSKKKMEKISLLSYKSRRKSIDVRIDGIDSKDPNRTATNVSQTSGEENKSTKLESNEKLPLDSTDLPINRLPEAGKHIQQNYNNPEIDDIQENVKNNASNKSSGKGEVFAQTNEQVIHRINDALIQDEPNTPVEVDIDAKEDTVKTNLNNIAEDSSHHLKLNNCDQDNMNILNDDLFFSDEDISQENVTSSKVENITVDCHNKINILSNITINSPSYTPPYPKKPQKTLEVNVDLKESRNTNSRKSLFKIDDSVCLEETVKPLTDILETKDRNSYTPPHAKKPENNLEGNNNLKEPGNTKRRKSLFQIPYSVCLEETVKPLINILETKDCNSDPLPVQSSTPENQIQVSKNGPQAVLINSKKPKSRKSEYLDELQEQVKTITGDMSPRYSSPRKSNLKTDHFDTEGLQKCLEEDITKPNAKILDHTKTNVVIKDNKLSSETQNPMAQIGLEKNKIKFEKDERVNKTKKRKREHTHNKDKIAETPSFIPSNFDNKKMLELFGPMTPSPCKTEEIIKQDIVRDKAKRNIIKSGKYNSDNIGFKIRDKSEEACRKNISKEVIKVNESLQRKSESKQKLNTVTSPEKCKQLSKKVNDKKIGRLEDFCTNPTYIPNIRDTPKAVFDSPNHYISKKNEEMKEKIKRNLIENPSSKKIRTENFMQETVTVGEEIEEEENIDEVKKEHNNLSEKNIETSNMDDFIGEDKCGKKTKPQKLKRKNKNSKDEADREDDKTVPKVKAKRGKKSLRSKYAEVLNEEINNIQEEKKKRSPSFKIKISPAKKIQKVNARENTRKKCQICILDSNVDSDSIEQHEKVHQKGQTVKKMVSYIYNNKIKNKKANVGTEDHIEDSSVLENNLMSDSRQMESKTILKPKQAVTPRKKGRRKKLIKTECHNEEQSERFEKKQRDNYCGENVEVKERSQISVTADSDVKELSKKTQKYEKTKNCVSGEETSLTNIPNSSSKSKIELVKPIKRITPTRIGDCTLSKEKEQKFKDLKAKRELFIEHPESLLNSNKRRRLSIDSDDYTTKKHHKVTYTESRTTVGEGVVDNGAQTRIKVQETQLNIEIAPNCSPLPRIEQIYDALSKNTTLNKNDGNSPFIEESNPPLQPTYEQVYPDSVLPATENTLPLLNLDTKDLNMLGPLEKDIYKNLSEFSLSGNSMLFANVVDESKKGDKDSNDDNIRVERDKNKKDSEQLSFTNFLNNKNPNTSTPIKNDQPKIVNRNSKQYPVNVTASQTNVKIVQSNAASVVSSSSIAGTTVTTVRSLSSSDNSNVSNNKTYPGTTNNVSSGTNVCKKYVPFSRPLKRDRRRPISVMIED